MRKILVVCLATTAVACGGTRPGATPAPARAARRAPVIRGAPLIPPTWSLRARGVNAPHAMVVSAHPLASQVGVDILKQGGNAIDAAIAVAFALEVVLPDAGNIGGGGFIVQRTAGGEVTALDYREAAPSRAGREMYLDSAGNVTDNSRYGHLAVGVPGSVAGLHAAWTRDGSLPWADLIAAEMQRGGGLITKEDLRSYQPKWRTPVQLTYRGYTIYSMPPPSSGGVTMGEMLNMLEGYDTIPAFGTAGYVHLLTEVMRRAFIDRNRWLGDPDFVDMPLDRLLSKSYAATLRA